MYGILLYLDTAGKNTTAMKEHSKKEDLEYDQMTLVEYIDSFTGEPVKEHKSKPFGEVVGKQSKPVSPS